MKKFQLLIVCLFLIAETHAQSVIHNINFDNYTSASVNDFTDYFNGNTTLYQIPSSGITGGCIATPDSNNWGNDLGYFCAAYKGNSFVSTYSTSICFKFDSTIYNTGSLDRICTIWHVPSSDFNHYMISNINHDKKIQVLTYSYANTSFLPTILQHNHWYKFQVNITIQSLAPNYAFGFGALVYDLGLSGTSSPTLSNSLSGGFNDNTLAIDTNIAIGISGTRYGGAIYLDDFHFEGIKGSDLCPVSSVTTTDFNDQVSVQQYHDKLVIDNQSSTDLNSYIYDINGRLLLKSMINRGRNEISIASLPQGIYIYNIEGMNSHLSEKIVVMH